MRMMAFDFEPPMKEWRRACAAQGWYWSRDQYGALGSKVEGPLRPDSRITDMGLVFPPAGRPRNKLSPRRASRGGAGGAAGLGHSAAHPVRGLSGTTQLVLYDAMCRAIAAAYAVDEVKDIRDKALALEVYARQAQNVRAEWQAHQVRKRAERKGGELLAEREVATGGQPYQGDGSTGPKSAPLHSW
jgi:hypothetical protein